MSYTQQRRPHIDKQALPVVVYTNHHRIEGIMHVSFNHRALDTLNFNESFIPVTEARIYSGTTDTLLAESAFVALNKREVVFLYEREGAAQPNTP